MRPAEFTGGNNRIVLGIFFGGALRFNEAAGIHRRKPAGWHGELPPSRRASMRPPEFTGGNNCSFITSLLLPRASMRPPEFTGGNIGTAAGIAFDRDASMRPPEFTGGNICQVET